MAEYIDDSGVYGQDALFSGTKGTDYDYDEANEIVWFSATGTSDTNFELPDSEWLLYEVYNPDSHTNDLGGTNVHGKKEWTSDVGTVATTILAWKTAFDLATSFTTYDVKVTHYKGSDEADVYVGDESTAFSLDSEDNSFTGYGSNWVMEDELFADSFASNDTYTVHLSFNKQTDPTGDDPQDTSNNTIDYPAGVYGNDFLDTDTGSSTEHTTVDSENNSVDVKVRLLGTWNQENKGSISTTEIDALTRHQMVNHWVSADQDIEILLPVGTHTVRAAVATGSTDRSKYTFNGTTYYYASHEQPTSVYKEWADIVVATAAWYTMRVQVHVGTYGRISGIDVIKTA